MRKLIRSTLLAGLTGSLVVGAAYAGVVLPVPTPSATGRAPAPQAGLPLPGAATGTASGSAAVPAASALKQGLALVGAAKTSIAPDPAAMRRRGYPAARWETDRAKCETLDEEYLRHLLDDTAQLDHLASVGSPWPENPDCIYQGGFGIGPMNAVEAYDTVYGLWVRSVAIGDGEQTLVLTVVDGEGWFWDYARKCETCGAKQIADALAKDPELKARGVGENSFVLHATHAHSAPDFIGGWGFVPDWYMAQVTEAIRDTSRRAVLGMVPAVVEVGEVEARAHNHERRDTYRSAEEQQLAWLRAVATSGQAGGSRVVATIGAYAAHPTTKGTNGGVAHADWPGVFAHEVEQRFGGIGMHLMTGLGNMSASGGTAIGERLAAAVPDVGAGRRLADTDLRLDRTTWAHPVTNAPLDALGTPGFFDRQFDRGPERVVTGKEPETAPCISAAPQSVELSVTAARLGTGFVLTAGPGELFANLTNTIKDKNAGRVTMPVAQANDALGYMPQSFELNPVGQQGLGFVAGGKVFVNYEDSYAIDRCVGDAVLENTLALLGSIE